MAEPLFVPARATLVIAAPGVGLGHWAGAPSAIPYRDGVLLAYRLRAPRPQRGYELRLAIGDGRTFRDVWTLHREELQSVSLERASLVAVAGGIRLYVSCVDPVDGRWRIDVLEAERPDRLDPTLRRPALTAGQAGVEAVKDPVVVHDGDGWLMFASFGSRDLPAAGIGAGLHASQDALSSGQLLSCTGLATSADGLDWRWAGPVLLPAPGGWDAYETRLSTIVRDGDRWLGLYDGIASPTENYEERTGLASSADRRVWTRLSADGPALRSAQGSGCLRYACAVPFRGETLVYHEAARADGAHELRVAPATSGR